MQATIETVAINHNGVCFHTGQKVSGRLRGVAIIKDSEGNALSAMPVSKEYMEQLQAQGNDDDESDDDE